MYSAPDLTRFTAVAAAALLLTAGLADAGSSPPAQAAVPATVTPFTEQLPIPAEIDLRAGGSAELVATPGTHMFHSGLPATPSWGYVPKGSTPTDVYLGPTLEVTRGAPVSLSVTNDLAGPHPLAAVLDTTLHGATELDKTAPRIATHLHGGHTPPQSDGGPTDTFRPAGTQLPAGETDYAGGTGTYSYQYPNDQEAATLWYHDHALGITRLNVMAGLAGFYLLRDGFDTGDSDNPLRLPAGDREVPLVLQDRSFNPDGTLNYPLGPWAGPADCGQPTMGMTNPCQWLPEFFGDVATVNGKAWPNHSVARDVYRFRLLNGSNARVYDLKLQAPGGVANAAMYQIGADGGLLNAPVKLNRLVIAPGERADVLVDFRAVPAGTRIVLANSAPTPYPNGPRAGVRGGAPLPQIMQFTVGSQTGAGAVPTTLRGGPNQPAALPALTPVRTRTVALNEVMGMTSAGIMAPMTALLNNTHWDTAEMALGQYLADPVNVPFPASVEGPAVNTVEEWRIVNTTADTHPIHLHLVQFKVKDRQKMDAAAYLADWTASGAPVQDLTKYLSGKAKGPSAEEAGWKDTVKANPGEVTRILVPFGGSAAGVSAPYTGSFTGSYVWHCHILEHEDNDMMLPYQVLPTP